MAAARPLNSPLALFLQVLLVAGYAVALGTPWARVLDHPGSSTWLTFAAALVSNGVAATLVYATYLVTFLALALAAGGAAMRVLGQMRVAGDADRSARAHRGRLTMVLGAILFAGSVSILTPPLPALGLIVAVALLQAGLLLMGEQRVSRGEPPLLPEEPGLREPALNASAGRRIGRALLQQSFYLGYAVCFACFAWSFNAQLLLRCLVICFGGTLIVQALLPAAPLTTRG